MVWHERLRERLLMLDMRAISIPFTCFQGEAHPCEWHAIRMVQSARKGHELSTEGTLRIETVCDSQSPTTSPLRVPFKKAAMRLALEPVPTQAPPTAAPRTTFPRRFRFHPAPRRMHIPPNQAPCTTSQIQSLARQEIAGTSPSSSRTCRTAMMRPVSRHSTWEEEACQ